MIENVFHDIQQTKNYTDVGYKKLRAPADLFKMLSEFWEKNKDKGTVEQWGTGNTYTYVTNEK